MERVFCREKAECAGILNLVNEAKEVLQGGKLSVELEL